MSGVATAIGAAAVVGAGATIYASNQSSNAAKRAASAQEAAAQSANQTQLSMFNTITGNEQPYNATGQKAASALAQFYGLGGNGANAPNYNSILANLPGYQFQLQQGTQAIDRSEAAKGLLNSGATGKALEQYGQGLAGSYASQYATGLSGLAQLGQAAASNQASAGMNAANQIGSNTLYAGNAAAAGYANSANAINSGLGQAVGLYGMYQNYNGGAGYGSNPYNLGGSIQVAPQGSNLTYDQWGNITGSTPAAAAPT